MKILFLSDSTLFPTGYSKTSGRIAEQLGKINEVYYIGFDNRHKPLKMDNYLLLEGGTNDSENEFYCRLFMNDINPDIVFTNLNLRRILFMPKLIKQLGFKGKWFHCYSLDMEFIPKGYLNFLNCMDKIVVVSDFVKNLLDKTEVKDKVIKIPYGIDTEIFKPMQKDETFMKRFDLEKFKAIIGFVGINQFRKMIPKLLFGYKLVKENFPEACLIMHTPEKDENDFDLQMYSIKSITEAFDIKDVILDEFGTYLLRNGTDDSYMARLFSLFDIYFSAAGSEGFGLPLLEAMSMGIPIVTTNYTTPSELVGTERGFLVNTVDWDMGFNTEFTMRIDEAEAAKRILSLISDSGLREKMGKAGRKFALDFDWKKVMPKWEEVFKI